MTTGSSKTSEPTGLDSPDSLLRVGVKTVDEVIGETLPSPDPPEGKESEEELSDDEILVGSPTDDTQSSLDTAALSSTDRAGVIRADDAMCQVLMMAKTPELQGHTRFCGNPATSCSRRAHKTKQSDPTSRATTGVYEGILNANKKIVDGILETFTSFEDRVLQSRTTLQEMEEAIYKSAQKERTEQAFREKTPTTLTFNLEEQPPSSNMSRQEQMKAWRDALDDPTEPPSAYSKRPSLAPTPQAVKTSTSLSKPVPAPEMYQTLERLTDAICQKLDNLQSQHEKLSRDLI
jgi:hypothetical protein